MDVKIWWSVSLIDVGEQSTGNECYKDKKNEEWWNQGVQNSGKDFLG